MNLQPIQNSIQSKLQNHQQQNYSATLTVDDGAQKVTQ